VYEGRMLIYIGNDVEDVDKERECGGKKRVQRTEDTTGKVNETYALPGALVSSHPSAANILEIYKALRQKWWIFLPSV
jgi:hypothetical protein